MLARRFTRAGARKRARFDQAGMEQLESRVLWAANLCPGTVAGLVLEMTVTAGSGDFDSSGKFQFRAAKETNSYQIIPIVGGISGSGTYTSIRTSATTMTIRATDTAEGITDVAVLTFGTLTTGTFSATAAGLSGSESGTFKIVGTVEPLAEVDNGVLVVEGTFADDGVGIGFANGKVNVTQNNWTTSFTAASLTGINVDLEGGSDTLAVGSGVMGIYCFAGEGNDNLLGGDGRDTFTGGAGKDTLDGGFGDDRLNGSGSNDSIIGGVGNDRLYGGDGNDNMQGGGNVDRLFGGNGNDILIGGGSNDKLYGEAGNDTLYGNAGSDILNGGDGTDQGISDGTDNVALIP